VLDHDHCVCAWRHGRARHDFDRFTCPEREIGMLAGADFTGNPELPGKIRGSDGEPIAHGAIEWRVIPIRARIPRQNAPERNVQPNRFSLRSDPVFSRFAQNHVTRVAECQGLHAFSVALYSQS
jgi:hypothetical protein